MQAFPEAAHSGIKIIYGMECTLNDVLPAQSTLVVLAKNQTGLKNLYKLVSWSHIENSIGNGRRPRVTKEKLTELRDGLLIGSGSETGWLYRAIEEGRSEEELLEIARFFDYLEICREMSHENILHIIRLGEELNIPVCATGNVYHKDCDQEISRHIILNDEPRWVDSPNPDGLYLEDTEWMLESFSFLGRDTAYEVVITNTKRIASMIEEISPIPRGKYYPTINGAEKELKECVYRRAEELYGASIPGAVRSRIEQELEAIIPNGYAMHYITAKRLAENARQNGRLVSTRGGIAASFVAYLAGITQINPLPSHYLCPNCHRFELSEDGFAKSGYELPEKKCPVCGTVMTGDGLTMPFEVYAGAMGTKEPSIDLVFESTYIPQAEKVLRSIFGEDKVFRAGTVETLGFPDARKLVHKYSEKYALNLDDNRIDHFTKVLAESGIKSGTRLRPCEHFIIPNEYEAEDFTPLQFTLHNENKVLFSHFDSGDLNKTLFTIKFFTSPVLDKLAELKGKINADIPMNDPAVYSLFSSPEVLGVTADDIFFKTGTLSIPYFFDPRTNDILEICKPQGLSELIKVYGLRRNSGTWRGNAEDLLLNDTVTLDQVIAFRDDIVNDLMAVGMEKSSAVAISATISHFDNKLGIVEQMMCKRSVPEWYIESVKKIMCLSAKADAAERTILAVMLAWYKLYHPAEYYKVYFNCKRKQHITEKALEIIQRGKEEIRKRIIAADYANIFDEEALKVANEAICRGVDLDEIIR